MVKNNRRVNTSTSYEALSHSQSSSNFPPARSRNATDQSRSPMRSTANGGGGGTKALSQMPKGHFESPLKRFAR